MHPCLSLPPYIAVDVRHRKSHAVISSVLQTITWSQFILLPYILSIENLRAGFVQSHLLRWTGIESSFVELASPKLPRGDVSTPRSNESPLWRLFCVSSRAAAPSVRRKAESVMQSAAAPNLIVDRIHGLIPSKPPISCQCLPPLSTFARPHPNKGRQLGVDES